MREYICNYGTLDICDKNVEEFVTFSITHISTKMCKRKTVGTISSGLKGKDNATSDIEVKN